MRVSLMIEGQEGVTWQQWCDLADACVPTEGPLRQTDTDVVS